MNNKKNAQKSIKFWLSCAEDNFKAGQAMLKAGRWSLAMFMCQQTIEAELKAIYIFKKKERPIYIHRLPRLLDLTGIKASSSIDNKILKIDAHYIKARYQEDRFNHRIYNRKSAEKLVKDTKEVFQWLIKKAKLKL